MRCSRMQCKCNATQYNIMLCYAVQCIPMHSNAFQCIPMHYNAFQCITMHSNALQCIPIHYNAFQCISMHSNAFHPMHYNNSYIYLFWFCPTPSIVKVSVRSWSHSKVTETGLISLCGTCVTVTLPYMLSCSSILFDFHWQSNWTDYDLFISAAGCQISIFRRWQIDINNQQLAFQSTSSSQKIFLAANLARLTCTFHGPIDRLFSHSCAQVCVHQDRFFELATDVRQRRCGGDDDKITNTRIREVVKFRQLTICLLCHLCFSWLHRCSFVI